MIPKQFPICPVCKKHRILYPDKVDRCGHCRKQNTPRKLG